MVATIVFSGLRHARIGMCTLLASLLGATAGVAMAAPNYDFAYRVSGDRRVAPQQVFDDGASTYLQFYPGQVLPALIAVGADGSQRLLTHAQLGPYVTVPGTHVALVAQLGTVRAVVDYGGKAARVAGEDATGLNAVAAIPAPPAVAVGPSAGHGASFAPPWASTAATVPAAPAVSTATTPTPLGAATRTAFAAPPAGAAPARDVTPLTAPADTSIVPEAWPTGAAPPAKPFEATLADQNLRRALGRWATQAGWTFRAEHWTPDIDIAVSAPAVFGPDFKTAVRSLLAGTELSARPLQPCFYSNLVLRVVPQAERCDRRVAH